MCGKVFVHAKEIEMSNKFARILFFLAIRLSFGKKSFKINRKGVLNFNETLKSFMSLRHLNESSLYYQICVAGGEL